MGEGLDNIRENRLSKAGLERVAHCSILVWALLSKALEGSKNLSSFRASCAGLSYAALSYLLAALPFSPLPPPTHLSTHHPHATMHT